MPKFHKSRVNKIKAYQKGPKFQEPSGVCFLLLRGARQCFSPSLADFRHAGPSICSTKKKEPSYMSRIAALRPATSKFRFVHPSNGRWVSTVTPRKSADNDAMEGQVSKAEADPDPTVVFSRPPPVPPLLGPLVALSLLDSWLKRDSNDE